MDEQQKVFLATIYGEAAQSSTAAWCAIASVIMNRVGKREWRKLDTPLKVIAYSGFDAFSQRNNPYQTAWKYFDTPGQSRPQYRLLDELERQVFPIYTGLHKPIPDIVLYYSPKAQGQLHKLKPKMYAKAPRWKFDLLEQVAVPGTERDDFLFFKYKEAMVA